MKKQLKLVAVLLGLMCFSSSSYAQSYDSGVGGRFGTLFTASYQKFINESAAFEAIAGVDFNVFQDIFVVGAFYKKYQDLGVEEAPIQWYYGAGAQVGFANSTIFGPGGIVGLEYTLSDTPVTFFIDAVPTLWFGKGGSDFDINGYVGARYILSR